MEQNSNNSILILDAELQAILNACTIFKPNLIEACLPQLQKAPCNIEEHLKSLNIEQSLFVYCPKDLVYKDKTACFYLDHHIHKLMNNEHNELVFTWNDLLMRFIDFCTTNQENFQRKSDVIKVKENSPMSVLLGFQYFHIDQAEDILKQVTKLLGRGKFRNYVCPYFKKPLFPNPLFCDILNFIDDRLDDSVLPPFIPSLPLQL